MIIRNKQEMFDLQMHWRLGNCLQIWGSIPEVRKSVYGGPIAIRGLHRGMKMRTHILQSDLERATDTYLRSRRCTERDIVYSEMAAPSMGIRRLLNAELMEQPAGLYVQYGTRNVHMPEAMRDPLVLKGLRASMLLEYLVDPSDYDDLRALREAFPDSVFEISVLDRRVGWAHRRMVVWEVRNY